MEHWMTSYSDLWQTGWLKVYPPLIIMNFAITLCRNTERRIILYCIFLVYFKSNQIMLSKRTICWFAVCAILQNFEKCKFYVPETLRKCSFFRIYNRGLFQYVWQRLIQPKFSLRRESRSGAKAPHMTYARKGHSQTQQALQTVLRFADFGEIECLLGEKPLRPRKAIALSADFGKSAMRKHRWMRRKEQGIVRRSEKNPTL